MFKKGFLSAFSVLLLMFSVQAQISFKPSLKYNTGSVVYSIYIPQDNLEYYDNQKITPFVESELVFPVSTLLGGIAAQFNTQLPIWGRNRCLNLYGKMEANLNHPSAKMKDSDWIGANLNQTDGFSDVNSNTRMKFSYTESETKLKLYQGELGFKIETFTIKDKPLFLGVSWQYNHLFSEIIGVEGWQYGVRDTLTDSLEKFYFNLFQNEKVLTYQADYYFIALSAAYDLWKGQTVVWNVETDFAPISRAQDEDYHLLRNKRTNAKTSGLAFSLTNEIACKVTDRLDVCLEAGFCYLRNKGEMNQYWYDDESYGSGVEKEIVALKGTSLSGIENKFSSLTGHLSLSIRYAL